MTNSAAVVKTDTHTAPKTVKDWLSSPAFKDEIAKALPKHLTPDRQIRVALTAITRTPNLAKCSPATVCRCLIDLSTAGLEPDGRRAHLIPYRNGKTGGYDCQLIIDYKGLVELAMRSGTVSNIHADVICDKDVFQSETGRVRHLVNYREPRGKVYAVYALVRFKDGGEKSEVMTRDEIEAIRKRSKAGGSGPWVTDWNEMAKKTVARRALKWVPLSPEIREAVEKDDEPIDIHATPARPTGGLSELIDGQATAALTAGEAEPEAIDDDANDHDAGSDPEAAADTPTETEETPADEPAKITKKAKREPKQPEQTFTAEQRAKIIDLLENLMLDENTVEKTVLTWAKGEGLVKDDYDGGLFELPTVVLASLLDHYPSAAAATAEKGGK